MPKRRYCFVVLSAFLLILWSCQKEKAEEDFLQEVTFGITNPDLVLKTDSSNFEFACKYDSHGNLLLPTHADIVIKDSKGDYKVFTPRVFFLHGKLYSQSIRLAPGTYTVCMFLLRQGEEGPILMATPSSDSEFATYITPGRTIEYTFTVEEFMKAEVKAEVLCFEPGQHKAFGFNWSQTSMIVLRKVCFQGQICANHIPQYQEETAYAGRVQGQGNPWWYYFDTSFPESSQAIYAGQFPIDGNAKIQNNHLILTLGSWQLQEGNETVKIKGFTSAPTSWTSPGQFDIKTNTLQIDLSNYIYPYYIIHLNIRKAIATPDHTPFSTADFAGSLYEYIPGGIQTVMPALFKIKAMQGDTELPQSPFSNLLLNPLGDPLPLAQQNLSSPENTLVGITNPVCVQFPVYLDQSYQDTHLQLYAWVPEKTTGQFFFRHFTTLSVSGLGPVHTEEGEPLPETSGPIDFRIGNCGNDPPTLPLVW